MGNKSQKKTNQMLGQQTQAISQFGSHIGQAGQDEMAWKRGLRENIASTYWDKINGTGEEGGGGGGGGAPAWVDPATGMRSDIYGRYTNLADTGGWTDPEKTDFRSWTTAPIAGFYTGLKNQLTRANNATGGYAGYNSQTAKLGRDAARQGFLTALESESGLQDMIRSAKERGIAGMSQTAENISGASRPMGGGGGGGGGEGDEDDYYLRRLEGLMGNDLPYWQMQQGSYPQGTQSINARVDETPAWQKMAMSLAPSAINAGIGAFSGGGNRSRQPDPYTPRVYGDEW